MPEPADRYDRFYAEKLWALLPVVYRAEDAQGSNGRGPLRELVERMGVQAAVLRRSIDRLWADQSIETCEDWVIPYLARLLATHLVAGQDARGQRLDVAKTVYYRRRKGTLALLEELSRDVTGWSARAVEMFRLLGRTRHLLDPPLGDPASAPVPEAARALLSAQRLVGARTQTPAGGFADLRSGLGASRARTAFDEYPHSLDVRRGRGATGWHGIAKLGVFLWRLESLPVEQATPVQDQNCPNQYTFDPTGRDVPLFAAETRAFGDGWISPLEHQLPGPIDAFLFDEAREHLYRALDETTDPPILTPSSLAIYRVQSPTAQLVEREMVGTPLTPPSEAVPPHPPPVYLVDPLRGRLILRGAALAHAGALRLSYHYGFSSKIGAGPYDRRLHALSAVDEPPPVIAVAGGGMALETALAEIESIGTLSIDDFQTYDRVRDLGSIQNVTIRAAHRSRPLIRLPVGVPPPSWAFQGAGDAARLTLEGLFVSGGDIILRGTFDEVNVICCTLDPGEHDGSSWALSADGRPLLPCRLRVHGHVRRLVVDRSIVGPILEEPPTRTAGSGAETPSETSAAGGRIEQLVLTDSIVQAAGPDRALDLSNGAADLSRCTLLGRARLHRLHASECILHEAITVDDAQNGCVRFSAWARGSSLPSRFESLRIEPRATLFTSLRFGQPGFAQLLSSVDAAIAEGAEDGSEMGAFARDKNPIKLRSLLIKFQEYMPVGLEPVIIPVT